MGVQLARTTAERLVDRHGLRTAPIDVERLAASVGLRVIATDDLGADVSGLLVSRDGAASIAVRKTDPLVRRRFTIAHEIGHFVMRHHLRRNELVHADEHAQVMYRSPKASEGLDPLEVEANQFAASLLMPSKLVREEAAKLQRPIFEDDVKVLANAFKVSEQAMTIRLTTLGLL
jgi:Zn-dependent peptidase ImmA (M78 family)